jgi:hypothetical protein
VLLPQVAKSHIRAQRYFDSSGVMPCALLPLLLLCSSWRPAHKFSPPTLSFLHLLLR